MHEAYIYEAIRTPRGRGRQDGSLHSVKPISLLTGLMRELQQRHQLDTALIDDVVLGCATPTGEQGADLARIAALSAGWDSKACGVQLNRFCASGLEAVNLAAQKVRSGWEDLVLAGGLESMSRVPAGADGGAWSLDPETSLRTGYLPPGLGADLIATLDGYSREQLDDYALRSQQRAAAAQAEGCFASAVTVRDQNGLPILAEDELLRPATSADTLAALKPAFDAIGAAGFDSLALRRHPQLQRVAHRHTDGNCAPAADGAALLLIGNRAIGTHCGLRPRARIAAAAVSGAHPVLAPGTAAADASRKALLKAGLSVNDIDLFELDEAYAASALRYLRQMNISADKLNVDGGAIALGLPLGAAGCMLLASLLDQLERRRLRRGVAALCAAGGMGIATVIERVTERP